MIFLSALSGNHNLQSQLFRRILVSLVIAFTGGLAATLIVYRASDSRSRELQRTELASHFQARIQKLDNELLVQSDVFRAQLEFNRMLESPEPRHQKVTAYLNSIGGQQIFTQVVIFDSNRLPIFRYSTRSERMTEAPNLQGIEGLSWAYSPQTRTLYRSVEQKLWMGSIGSGWMMLYVPVDNTLLQSITYPGTSLRLQRDGKTLTTTETGTHLPGQDQLVEVVLPWGSATASPQLLVSKAYSPPLPLIETLIIVGLTTLLTLLLGTTLVANWLNALVKRLHALGEAAALFGRDGKESKPLAIQLALAEGEQIDEVTGLAHSLKSMINDAHKANADLLSSEQKFASIFLHSPVALALTRVEDDVCLDVNEAWTNLFVRNRSDVIGRSVTELVLYEDPEQRKNIRAQLDISPTKCELQANLLTGKGIRYAKLSMERVTLGDADFLVESFDDITERILSEQKINHLAFYDQLTQLPNRTLLIERIGQALASQVRTCKFGAVLMIDLDNFKSLNDTRGHAVGDQLLQEVAKRMQLCLRVGDTVARLGGDEFVVLLLGLSTEESEAARDVEMASEKLLGAIAQPYFLGDMPHHCTASIGISLFSDQKHSEVDLLKQADLAMYKAKTAGRNAIRFFNPSLELAVKQRVDMEHDLRQAIADKQFQLYFQPQVADGSRVIGAECLLRWTQPDGRRVSPGEFIALAEDSGLIIPLGRWVLEAACRQLAAWSESPSLAHLTLAVNVSAVQFRQSDFVETVLNAVKRSHANPARLKIELTESVLVSNINETIEIMHRLKAYDVGFSLDDFGTGFSSLTYLKRLPLDQLKIDQSFVRDLLTNPNDAVIAKTIIALGQSLGLSVIAEGVETPAQREFLAQSGCHAFQGFLFSRPIEATDFEDYVISA